MVNFNHNLVISTEICLEKAMISFFLNFSASPNSD